MRDLKSSGKQIEYVSHGCGFLQARDAGELEFAKNLVEGTHVDMDARGG